MYVKVPVAKPRKLLASYEKRYREVSGEGNVTGVCGLLSKCITGEKLPSQSWACGSSLREVLAEQPYPCSRPEMSCGSLTPAHVEVLRALVRGALTDFSMWSLPKHKHLMPFETPCGTQLIPMGLADLTLDTLVI